MSACYIMFIQLTINILWSFGGTGLSAGCIDNSRSEPSLNVEIDYNIKVLSWRWSAPATQQSAVFRRQWHVLLLRCAIRWFDTCMHIIALRHQFTVYWILCFAIQSRQRVIPHNCLLSWPHWIVCIHVFLYPTEQSVALWICSAVIMVYHRGSVLHEEFGMGLYSAFFANTLCKYYTRLQFCLQINYSK